MAQTTAHPGPRRLAGLAPASHLGLATSLGSKVEAGPPRPSFPSLQLRQGEGGGSSCRGRPWACVHVDTRVLCTQPHAGWLARAESEPPWPPPPSQGTRAPLHVCEGRHAYAHTHRHKRVCALRSSAGLCLPNCAHGPERQGPRTALGKGDGDAARGVWAAEASHSPRQQPAHPWMRLESSGPAVGARSRRPAAA